LGFTPIGQHFHERISRTVGGFYVRDGDGTARALLDADGSSGVFTAPCRDSRSPVQAAPLDRALVA
jgi:hypothetical protein